MNEICRLERTDWDARAQFIGLQGLIAIIELRLFWGGSKPPLNVYCFSGKQSNEEEDFVAVSEWLIQIFARKFHSPVFLYYIICLSLYIQNTQSGSVARR